ncbi:MAG: hypothetical protein LUD07_07870 [Clostridiales bacterium]|nr:hypothetical protein [Clostridiales bacterium]
MIEITCTRKEKEKLIDQLSMLEPPCIFSRRPRQIECLSSENRHCEKCLETRIKWNVRHRTQRESYSVNPR